VANRGTAILFGATGLVGRSCLDLLLRGIEYETIVSIGRRPSGHAGPRLVEKIVDFNRPDEVEAALPHRPGTVFYCMGTTIAKAGSREAFRKIDYELPLRIAKAAHADGADCWTMISSIGASPDSPSFYLRTKGDLERDVSAIPFRSIHILRPSLLLGEREENQVLEKAAMPIARALAPLLTGKLARYRPVEAAAVARAMIDAARSPATGTTIHYTD
jgi:uncharacterized protein YbjT (DUF2867 family)